MAFLLSISLRAHAADLVPVSDLGLRIERGFTITEFADQNLAPDTWCMTLDARGRVVVANGKSIRVLVDDDGDGQADDFITFADVERGVMGMCFDGNSLYVAADGWLSRYDDLNGDSVADGAPEKLLPLGFGEHGGHAMRKGPDGWWYLIGGNDTGFTADKHATLNGSPIIKPEAGALLRLTPDARQSEIITHGLRNAYDFDFNADGDIFTYDSDVESDAFLPWYEPTRVYHLGYGQHHGWRLTGYKRSWPRPDYYTDTVPILSRIGRGSPTGVTAYRHFQFPMRFRDGLFFADWTFGRIYFLPLEANGASYTVYDPDVFLEPIGTQGFAPTDLAVAPDGSLFISIGGRKTRGAVYHVEFTGRPSPPTIAPLANADLNNVLFAPQPLDAWSRAIWMPAAARLGAQPFGRFVSDDAWPDLFRVRAIEVLTEMFGGVPPDRARAASQSSSAIVRARLAWSLGRVPGENAAALLIALANDRDGAVRRCALDAIADQIGLFDEGALVAVTQSGLLHPNKYVRLAAVRVAGRMTDSAWLNLTTIIPKNSPAIPQAAIAQIWRTPDLAVHPEVVPALTNLLALTTDHAIRLDVVRLLILALGDWHLNNPTVEVFTGYELPTTPANEFNVVALRRMMRALIPSGNALLDTEAARLLAMLEDDDKKTPQLLANFLTDSSAASADFHYLACIAHVRASVPALSPRIAAAILALNRKLGGQETRAKQNWNLRLVEVVQQLIRREPSIADALLRHPQFISPAHVFLANALPAEQRFQAARRFLAAARANSMFPWSNELIALFAQLPTDDVVPLFRRQWVNINLRDELLPRLAEQPVTVDRDKFLAGLGSPQPPVVRVSLNALMKLPPDPNGTNLVAPLKLLSRTLAEPAEQPLRAQVASLIASSLKQEFKIAEPPGADAVALRKAYRPIFDYVGAKYPGLIRAMSAEDHDDPVKWNATWRAVPWARGDATRGEQIFAQRACAACHRSASAFGPDLAGAAQRMSPEDLMNAIVFPSRDIAPPYRTTTFRLRNGESYTGIVAYESADGWIVQTGAGANVRVNSADVLARQPSGVSVMPSGLLNGLNTQELADLYAFLRTL
ncbi:MAG TPA: HEAT repeat domain-containing protein [Candidatus Limnocylindria bacterium]|nr:HEAT repeat domain-containing protein [Candidatus Limnocylindria bacterium]